MWLVAFVLVAVVVEAASAIALESIARSKAGFLIWKPRLSELGGNWDTFAGQWDDELGWPSAREDRLPPRDPSGAKQNPRFPDSRHACVSAYGDSFVWGDDVPLQLGWVEQLSDLLDCRVSNYGVSGYGTDQAFVRFQRNVTDNAPVALLGIFPENIMRNVNQFRALFGYNQDPRWVKGRFVLGADGALNWIPRPRLDRIGFMELVRDLPKALPHEYFLPDSRDGPVTAAFPHVAAAVRLAASPRLRTRMTGKPSWAGFYESDHPSRALPLTAAIASAYAREAAGRGRKSLVLILPAASSFRTLEKHGAFEYVSLVAELTSRKVDVFDLGPALAQSLRGRSACELYAQPEACAGHFGVFGSRLVAEAVAGELRRRGWVLLKGS